VAIPDYQTVMLPLLQQARDGNEYSLGQLIDALADAFSLTEAERQELLPSGAQPVFNNRVSWARTYLTKAGLLVSPRRGFHRITDRGCEVLAANPIKIDLAFLNQFPEFVEFKALRRDDAISQAVHDAVVDSTTPQEALELAYQRIRGDLEAELLDRLKKCSPAFFERLVVDLLVKMGYGGSRQDAGRAIGRSGDEGIDGIIKEDKLGLDVVYIQAKRWNSAVVGRPEIHRFVGALVGQRARKGVFITTSTFSNDARTYAQGIENKVVLIDGQELASLMIEHGVGVTTLNVYEVKRIDSDYFAEE
jgi:restriction system protein